MILVDTSIWVEHLRRANAVLAARLGDQRVSTHPFVIGELALGGAGAALIDDLREMPRAIVATDHEMLAFIERHGLIGRGIGYLDAHLLASALLTGDTRVWTLDKSLRAVAEDMGIADNPTH